MKQYKLYYLFLLLGFGFLFSTNVPVKAATPTLHNISVQKGKKASMKVTGLDKNKYPSSTRQWSSSNTSIVSVSSKGIVTGKKPGKTNITLTVKNTQIRLTATVRVVSWFRTKSVKITNQPEEPLIINTKYRLKAKVSPSRAKYKKVLWSSSKKKVATISAKGTIKALKKGTTTITATVKGTTKKTSFKLRVKKPVKLKKITITGDSEVYVGNYVKLTATLTPKNTTYDNIIWKSGNKKVAAINQHGQLFGLKKGKTTITAKEKNTKKKAKFVVHVLNVPVAGIRFDTNNIISMKTGEKRTLTVHISPANATNQNLKWKTSNSAASVDENGLVTALRPTEKVEITATSADNKTAVCTWTIQITQNTGYVTKSTLDNLDLTVIDKVMISTHPDDETLWGGGHLLEDEYLVVCMTNGWNQKRKQAFIETMKTTNDKYIILDYPDVRKYLGKGKYETDLFSTCKQGMQNDIKQILTYKKWKQIVTHNPNGEYGKYHHQQVSKMVTDVYQKHCKNTSKLWYFGKYYDAGKIPGEQIAPELLAIKNKMINRYYPTAKGAIKAFGHMIPYENWVPADEWK